MERVKEFVKKEIVLIISLLLAVVSAFFVPPSRGYADYIDFRTLGLLFSLMAIMAGLNRLGVFYKLAQLLMSRVRSLSGLTLVLVMICFFMSMIITNDVALITFVPFTIVALKMSDSTDKLIYVVTLETIAANLGSMLTPIGNPQNLYLYSSYNMSMTDFFATILPYAVISLVLLVAFSFAVGKRRVAVNEEKATVSGLENKHLLLIYSALLIVAILCVLRVLHFAVVLVAVIFSVVVFDRRTFKNIDYSLLATFVFLFIFIGNLGNVDSIHSFLSSIVSGNEVIAGVLSSQVISNVPAAILLSGFTDNARSLLVGVNLGGLGTLIASMASLISFKLIQKENVKTGKYLVIFTAFNVLFLAVNILLWIIIK